MSQRKDKIKRFAQVTMLMLTGRIKFPDPDPVLVCETYRNEGCAHVDGFLCSPRTCRMRKQPERNDDYEDDYGTGKTG